jgi:dTDP-4-dehydrorhamnose 3,5-epimerase
MKQLETPLKDLFVIEPTVFGDDRGFFYEGFNAEKFAAMGVDFAVKQVNISRSAKGVLRGLHFQLPPKAQAKYVRCTRGRLWDAVVDLRKDSPTYLKWYGVELSEANKLMLFVPAGFGHGFYALEDCDMEYLVSDTYSAELDGCVRFDDPAFGIEWPVEGEPVLSAKDEAAPSYANLNLPF